MPAPRKAPTRTDSAGQPWAGRSFAHVTASTDDGSAPPALLTAVERFQHGEAGEDEVVDVLREVRLFVPLVAKLAEPGVSNGKTADKRAELSIVNVAGPDGRDVLPAFSSVEALQRWNQKARPVVQKMQLIALAAASDGTDLVVLDPTSPTEFAIRRPALWALAQEMPWLPSYSDPAVLAEFVAAARPEPRVAAVQLVAGDPSARLTGPELVVLVAIDDGAGKSELDAIVARMRTRWTASTVIAERVDSLGVRLVPSAGMNGIGADTIA
jgi:hypothetical protein